MNIIPIFPKVIYKDTLKCLTVDNLETIKKFIDFDLIPSKYGDGSYTKNQFILDEQLFCDIKVEIIEHIKKYIDILGHNIEDVKISSSWANVVQPNNSIQTHVHGNSYISGCFYLTSGSSLMFYDSMDVNEQFTFSPTINFDPLKPWTYECIEIKPSIGDIILFPSLLKHSVQVNEYANRYSLAFNSVPVGSIGRDTTKLIMPT